MPGTGEVDALFARMLDDKALLGSLLTAHSEEERRDIIRATGFPGRYTIEDVQAQTVQLLDGHPPTSPGGPPEESWQPGPGQTWADAPQRVRHSRRVGLVFAALAAAAAAEPTTTAPAPPFKATYVILGTMKGGTTALHHFLSQHPEICTSAPKETHFFCRDFFFFENGDPKYDLYRLNFRFHAGQAVIGEATPHYMNNPTVAERLVRHNPHAKLIFVLRHPADRAYSHYRMAVHYGMEDRSFAEAIRQRRAPAVMQVDPLFPDAGYLDYVEAGFYTTWIAPFLRLFPRQNILFLSGEELRRHHHESVTAVLGFLGVDPRHVPRQEERLVGSGPPMDAADRAYLLPVYEAEVAALESLLGWDLEEWRR